MKKFRDFFNVATALPMNFFDLIKKRRKELGNPTNSMYIRWLISRDLNIRDSSKFKVTATRPQFKSSSSQVKK